MYRIVTKIHDPIIPTSKMMNDRYETDTDNSLPIISATTKDLR